MLQVMVQEGDGEVMGQEKDLNTRELGSNIKEKRKSQAVTGEEQKRFRN